MIYLFSLSGGLYTRKFICLVNRDCMSWWWAVYSDFCLNHFLGWYVQAKVITAREAWVLDALLYSVCYSFVSSSYWTAKPRIPMLTRKDDSSMVNSQGCSSVWLGVQEKRWKQSSVEQKAVREARCSFDWHSNEPRLLDYVPLGFSSPNSKGSLCGACRLTGLVVS